MRVHSEQTYTHYIERGWWSEQTLDDLLEAQVLAQPHAIALIDPANKAALTGQSPRRLSWAEVDAEVRRFAGILLAHGLHEGDVLAVQLPNSVEQIICYLGALRIGVILTPYPLQYGGHEMRLLSGWAGVAGFVTHTSVLGRRYAEQVLALLADVPALRVVLAWGPDGPEEAVCLDQAMAERRYDDPATAYRHRFTPHANDCATICWTSGTESTAKGVPRSHALWLPAGLAMVDGAGLTHQDVLLNPFPLVNMAGFASGLLPWLMTGCTLVQHQPFDLPTFLGQITAHRVSFTCAPPALLMLLLLRPEILAAADISSLRMLGSGSAPLNPTLIENWAQRFGIEIINFFGSNEGVALVGDPMTIPDHRARAEFFPRMGAGGYTSSNRVFRGLRTRLVDLVTGVEITAPGRLGELRVAGPTVFAGYLDGAADTPADPFDEQGFLRTGDLFEIAADASGDPRYYRFVDRAKDIIIRGGHNISAAEVEGLLQGHPDVAEVAVIGAPDAVLGERVLAVVVPRPGARVDLDGLREHLIARDVASFKLPERVAVVSELPRNGAGKLLKRQLRAALPSPT